MFIGLSSLLLSAAFASSVSAAVSYETEITSGVNFRDQPNTHSHIYRLLSKGEDIHVIEKVNSYWLKVQVQDGTTGYISANSKYTDYQTPAAQNYEAEVVWGVNFRDQPNTNGYKYRMLQKGEKIQVIEKINQDWLKIRVQDGTIGYISADPKYTQSGSSGTSSGNSSGSVTQSTRDRLVDTAKTYLGDFQYKWGAEPWTTNNRYTDCSAYIQLIFRNHGIDIPRNSRSQSQAGSYVPKSNLQKGDLVFFDTNSDGSINHVGLYIGGGEFIHASPSFDGVGISNLTSGFWSRTYETGRRIL